MKILLINGFNSYKGSKFDKLSKFYDVICPELENEPLLDFMTLCNIIKDDNIDVVVGTSLGGFYGLELSLLFPDIKFILINPSTEPKINMVERLGKTCINYKTNKPFLVTQQYIDDLESLRTPFVDSDNRFYFIGSNDKVVDPNILFNKLCNYHQTLGVSLRVNITNQDHRHSNITNIIECIENISVFS